MWILLYFFKVLFWHTGSYLKSNVNILRLVFKILAGWIHSSFYSSANLAHYWSATLLKMLPNAPSIRGSLYFDRWEYVFPDLWGTEIVWFTAFHSILSLSPKPLFKYSTDLLHPVQRQLVLNKTFKLLQISEEFFFL